MEVILLPIAQLQLPLTSFYTVRLEGKQKSEFLDFQERMAIDVKDKAELAEINRYILNIGMKYGAVRGQFRDERAAEALPPEYHCFIETGEVNDYGLRLYCIRICPAIVILLNGDRKTTQLAQDCPRCSRHFNLAQRIAKAFDQAKLDQFIEIDCENGSVEVEDDFCLTI